VARPRAAVVAGPGTRAERVAVASMGGKVSRPPAGARQAQPWAQAAQWPRRVAPPRACERGQRSAAWQSWAEKLAEWAGARPRAAAREPWATAGLWAGMTRSIRKTCSPPEAPCDNSGRSPALAPPAWRRARGLTPAWVCCSARKRWQSPDWGFRTQGIGCSVLFPVRLTDWSSQEPRDAAS
jgi:hypothetical protein